MGFRATYIFVEKKLLKLPMRSMWYKILQNIINTPQKDSEAGGTVCKGEYVVPIVLFVFHIENQDNGKAY